MIAIGFQSFKTAGYLVDCCTSFDQLHQALIRVPLADAVAVSECFEELPQNAVSLTRAMVSIPLILFRSADPCLDEADFDLIVSAYANPNVWVREVEQLIEESRATRARTQVLRQDTKLLIERSGILRQESAVARQKSRSEREPTESNRRG